MAKEGGSRRSRRENAGKIGTRVCCRRGSPAEREMTTGAAGLGEGARLCAARVFTKRERDGQLGWRMGREVCSRGA